MLFSVSNWFKVKSNFFKFFYAKLERHLIIDKIVVILLKVRWRTRDDFLEILIYDRNQEDKKMCGCLWRVSKYSFKFPLPIVLLSWVMSSPYPNNLNVSFSFNIFKNNNQVTYRVLFWFHFFWYVTILSPDNLIFSVSTTNRRRDF